MGVTQIPAEDIERSHWYAGPGKPGEYAYKHIPSGIVVGGVKPPQMKVHEFDQLLFAQLLEKLKAAGIIADA